MSDREPLEQADLYGPPRDADGYSRWDPQSPSWQRLLADLEADREGRSGKGDAR